MGAEPRVPGDQRAGAGGGYAALAESVGAANGEPWLTTLSRDEARGMAVRAGLELVGQPLLEDWVEPALWQRDDVLRPSRLWAMLQARVPER